MKINVTRKDIRNGKPRNFTSCPIALACKRAGLKLVKVKEFGIEFNYDYRRNSRSVLRFIRKFDARNPVKPFRFILDV